MVWGTKIRGKYTFWNTGEGHQRHEQMYRYTQDLAIEYTTDFENKIQYGGYSLEEEDIIAQEYKKALADKVG